MSMLNWSSVSSVKKNITDVKVGYDNNKKDPSNSKYNDTKIEIEDPSFVSGFTTEDGYFSASSSNNNRKAFRVIFFLTQHARD